jgi:hypothetical protein
MEEEIERFCLYMEEEIDRDSHVQACEVLRVRRSVLWAGVWI